MRMLAAAALLSLAQAAPAQTVEELKRQLAERDAEIRQLRERLQALESRAAVLSRPDTKAQAEEEDLNRALERTLVQQGGLLLRPGTLELQPEISYAHWDRARGPLLRESSAALTLRWGLPRDFQIQARIPYLHVVTAGASTTAFGDASFALTKQLVREAQARPGLVAFAGWSARTGRDGISGGAPTGAGFDYVQAGVTAVKRYDPLVYYGGISYAQPLARDINGLKTEPGVVTGLRLGAILAATPHTSANVGLNLNYVGHTRQGGMRVAGSDTVLGTLQIGFGTVLSRTTLFNFSTDIRVTGAVPDFRFTASIPIRF